MTRNQCTILFLSWSVAACAFAQATGKPSSPPVKSTPPQARPAQPSKPGTQPRVQLSATQWDFGSLWWGDKCETDIEIKNVGNAPLEIRNVKTSCGCTGAKPNRTTLGPGESDKIHLAYNTEKGVVDVSQTATIETNDPAQPAITLSVRGTVKNLFDGVPASQIGFGQTCIDLEQTKSIELVNAYDQPLRLSAAAIRPDSPFTVRLQEIEAGKRYRLTATTRVPMKSASHYEHVELRTDSPQHPKFSVTISAYAMERVELMPPNVVVYSNQTPAAATEPRIVRFNYLKDKPVKILELRPSDPRIRAEVDETPAGTPPDGVYAAYNIRVTCPKFDEMPESGATVEIITDDAEERFQKISLPVTRFRVNPPPPSSAPAPPVAKSGVAPVNNGDLPRAQPAKKP